MPTHLQVVGMHCAADDANDFLLSSNCHFSNRILIHVRVMYAQHVMRMYGGLYLKLSFVHPIHDVPSQRFGGTIKNAIKKSSLLKFPNTNQDSL
jgi:hypothetical protein